MRVLFCKIHCPLMCYCKPSAAHIYTSGGALKLESASQRVPSTAYAVSGKSSSEGAGEEGVNGEHEAHMVLKSCIRGKPPPQPEAGKKSVQWMDKLGKELAEIKEFESSDTGDTDNEEESNRCLCVIL